MKKSLIFIIGILFMVGFVSGFIEPPLIPVVKPTPTNTVTVCASGCDYQTLEDADQDAQPGWLIQVKAGSYSSTMWNSNGAPGNEIVIEAFGDGIAYIQGETYLLGANVILDGGTKRELVFQRAGTGQERLVRIQKDNILLSQVQFIGPTGDCDNTGNTCILISGWPTQNPKNSRIYNSIFDSCSHKGIYVSEAHDVKIKNNIILNTGNTGIQINPHNTGAEVFGLNISGNALYNNGYCANMPGHNIFIAGDTNGNGIRDVNVDNNLLWGSNRAGLHIPSTVLQNYLNVYNNVFYNNGEYGISTTTSTTPNVIDYKNNIAFNNNLGETNFRTTYSSSNNLATDPQFFSIDSTSDDFLKLSPTSPAIDTGADLSGSVDEDYFGTSRPVDGNSDGTAEFDIGAQEYLSSCTPTLHPADLDCDDLIDITELMIYIDQWKNNDPDITINDLFNALVIWKV